MRIHTYIILPSATHVDTRGPATDTERPKAQRSPHDSSPRRRRRKRPIDYTTSDVGRTSAESRHNPTILRSPLARKEALDPDLLSSSSARG